MQEEERNLVALREKRIVEEIIAEKTLLRERERCGEKRRRKKSKMARFEFIQLRI